MSNKEEQSKTYIKPIILDRNKKYLKEDNWELGLEYTDFTGYEVQCAFEDGWDTAIDKSCEFIQTNVREYHKSGVFHVAEFIKDLRKALEE